MHSTCTVAVFRIISRIVEKSCCNVKPICRFAWSTTVRLRWLRYYVTGCLWKYSAKDVANAIDGFLAANITAERTITAKHTNFATG